MACFKPLHAYVGPGEGGKQKVRFRPGPGLMPMDLPCGQCLGCRVDRAADWAMRITHEAQLHVSNLFLTLTYSDELLPHGGSLVLRDVQLFMKRLRKTHGKLRYFLCGEYGETTWRPHYHAIVFGLALADLRSHKKTASGAQLYTSESLTKLWGLGHVYIGQVTMESAQYVARYATKKITGAHAAEHYRRVDTRTGEIHQLKPEFAVMSRNPGVGAKWIDTYAGDVYPCDHVVLGGRIRGKPPRFYDERVAKQNPELVAQLKQERKQFAMEPRQEANSTKARLAVRAEVLRARLALYKRDFDHGA